MKAILWTDKGFKVEIGIWEKIWEKVNNTIVELPCMPKIGMGVDITTFDEYEFTNEEIDFIDSYGPIFNIEMINICKERLDIRIE